MENENKVGNGGGGVEPALARTIFPVGMHLSLIKIAKQQKYVTENSDLQNVCKQPLCFIIRRGMSAVKGEDHGSAAIACGQRSW